MIKPEQLGAGRARPLFCQAIVRRPYEKPPPRPLFGGIRQRDRSRHGAAASEKRATALVWIRLLTVPTDRTRDIVRHPNTTFSHRRSRTPRSGTSRRRQETR